MPLTKAEAQAAQLKAVLTVGIAALFYACRNTGAVSTGEQCAKCAVVFAEAETFLNEAEKRFPNWQSDLE